MNKVIQLVIWIWIVFSKAYCLCMIVHNSTHRSTAVNNQKVHQTVTLDKVNEWWSQSRALQGLSVMPLWDVSVGLAANANQTDASLQDSDELDLWDEFNQSASVDQQPGSRSTTLPLLTNESSPSLPPPPPLPQSQRHWLTGGLW